MSIVEKNLLLQKGTKTTLYYPQPISGKCNNQGSTKTQTAFYLNYRECTTLHEYSVEGLQFVS